MMNSSDYEVVIDAAEKGAALYALLKRISKRNGRSPPDQLEHISLWVAWQYFLGNLTFARAARVMKALEKFARSNSFKAKHPLASPSITVEVSMAFEMAEFYKVFDADGPDPEMKYTLPLIADVITR